jgi:polyhydroxybutyrate depolymerase
LPVGYEKTKAYPLVFEAFGCGSTGLQVYPLSDSNNVSNAGNSVILVGLTPPPDAIGHSTHPGQGCFDNNEGDDSVDFAFYETLYDKLVSGLCVDRNRVFAAGHSVGGDLANELGCKYAGDPARPIRGVMSNAGALPTNSSFAPTCSTKPMAGMWLGDTLDPISPFSGTVVAINRAIAVNGCTGGDYPATLTANYPIGGSNAESTCQRITGCPALYPLVVCAIPGTQHSTDDSVANPGFSTFLKMFETAPLFTQ